MAKITFTETEVGKIRGSADDFPTGNKLSNGDAYLGLSHSTLMADGPKDSKTIFEIIARVSDVIGIQKNAWIQGAEGKDNIVVFPGSASDYVIGIAQSPQGRGGSQKFGDITMTDKEGNQIHLKNIKSIAFMDGKPDNPLNVVNRLESGEIAKVSVEKLHEQAFDALSPMDKCKHQAMTSDELGKMVNDQKFNGREKVNAAMQAAETKASKGCAR